MAELIDLPWDVYKSALVKSSKKVIRNQHLSGKPQRRCYRGSQELSWMSQKSRTKPGTNSIIESWVDSNLDSEKFLSLELIRIKIPEAFWVVSWFESIFVRRLWVISWVESKLAESELNRIKKWAMPVSIMNISVFAGVSRISFFPVWLRARFDVSGELHYVLAIARCFLSTPNAKWC